MVILLVVGNASALSSDTWINKGELAPYSGDLRTESQAQEDQAMIDAYAETVSILSLCQVELKEEKARSRRWWKRPAFWIPVTCVVFTVGLVTGASQSW